MSSSPRSPLSRLARASAKRLLRGAARRVAQQREDLPLSSWRLSRTASGGLTRDGVVLSELLERWGSPLHVVDPARLAANAAAFTACPAGASRACEVYYSYKTNPVPGVLRMLHASGLGAEVVSPYELWLALALGVEPKSIVYNGPAKSDASLALALRNGVGLINLDARAQIGRLAEIADGLGKKANIGIRVAEPGIGGQFGERIDTGAALAAFREALGCPALRVVALHAHFNGELAHRSELDAFLFALLAFTDELRSKLGLEIEILDVGGNLACPTVSPLTPRARRMAVTFGCEPVPRPPESVLSIGDYVTRVIHTVEEHYQARGRKVPRIFLEPGRAMTGNAQMLLCRVAGLRSRDEAGLTWAVLDAGQNVAEPAQNEIHQLFPLTLREGAPVELYRLTGPSCTLADQLYPAWRLPHLEHGDGLAIMDSGAYFVPFSTCFSYPRPAVVAIGDGREQLLRRAETFEDLVARDAGAERAPSLSSPRAPSERPAPSSQ